MLQKEAISSFRFLNDSATEFLGLCESYHLSKAEVSSSFDDMDALISSATLGVAGAGIGAIVGGPGRELAHAMIADRNVKKLVAAEKALHSVNLEYNLYEAMTDAKRTEVRHARNQFKATKVIANPGSLAEKERALNQLTKETEKLFLEKHEAKLVAAHAKDKASRAAIRGATSSVGKGMLGGAVIGGAVGAVIGFLTEVIDAKEAY